MLKISSGLFGQFVDFLYLYAMKKDEIIELLKEQIKGLRDDNNRLLDQIDALIKEVSSLKEALLQKGESLSKQQRLTKGLAKLVSNTSEQQQAPQSAISEEERQKIEAEKADKRKARKNNGAKRDMHYEMEEEEHVVYPDDPDFDINKARLFTTVPRICVRYECVPMRFIKHVYKIHTYTQEGRLFEGKTPASAFLNSSYDGSFIAGLMELRYIQSLPVERIINYFESHGFTLKKPTAHKLIEKASNLFENLYKCIRQTALSDPYKAADETYYKILVPEKNSKGKGVRKGYLWVVVGINTRMIYLLYDDGSRSERVILNELGSCKGIIQSDGYSPYRKLESDAYPNITRIPCLQHIKRKFIDCGEKDPDAKRIVELINALYQNEHKHKVGVEGWTVEQNLMHRKKYAPDILGEIKDVFDEIEERGAYSVNAGQRYIYSYIEKVGSSDTRATTRATSMVGTGLGTFFSSYMADRTTIGLSIGYVFVDSPAAKAGLRRGDVIVAVNGVTLNKNNYQQYMNALYYASGGESFNIGYRRYVPNEDLQKYELVDGSVILTTGTYNNNPVLYSMFIKEKEGNLNVAYLVYQGFDLNYGFVIMGNEIGYDPESKEIIVRPENYYDQNGRKTASKEELLEYIKHIYYVLMTRGIKGTYLYICDDNLRKYVSSIIGEI